jgi:peptide/nickel transport system permease protein
MTSRPVLEDLATFFPAAFELATTALLIATAIAVAAGIWAALQQRSAFDAAFRGVCLIG